MAKYIGVLILSVFCSLSWAGVYSGAVGIESIRARTSGGIDVRTTEVVNPACTNDGKFFRVENGRHGMTAKGVKSALSVALAAFSASKRVIAYVDTSTSYCSSMLVQIQE